MYIAAWLLDLFTPESLVCHITLVALAMLLWTYTYFTPHNYSLLPLIVIRYGVPNI